MTGTVTEPRTLTPEDLARLAEEAVDLFRTYLDANFYDLERDEQFTLHDLSMDTSESGGA